MLLAQEIDADSLDALDSLLQCAGIAHCNVSAVAYAYSEAELWLQICLLGVSLFFAMTCVLPLACNVLSCTILLPLYLWFARQYEPTLLGAEAPRSDMDPLATTFEDDESRVAQMLRARAEAGARLGRRLTAFLMREEYVEVPR